MNTIYKNDFDRPYGLHDMIITKIQKNGNNIKLFFADGYVESKEPFNKAGINIIIEDVDLVKFYILSENGKFEGNKIENIEDIIDKIISIEIVNELYSYNSLQYNGFVKFKNDNKVYEVSMYIYYFGNMVYEAK